MSSQFVKTTTTRTDTERLDALQRLLGTYSNRVRCRWSTHGRGWRLHESSEGVHDIREAIDLFLDTTGQQF